MTKVVRWVGDSVTVVRSWPEVVRQRAGYELFRVQEGERPTDSRPLHGTEKGVFEIRIHKSVEYRIAYMTDADRVTVLHAWIKKSPRTQQRTLDLIRQRSKAIGEH